MEWPFGGFFCVNFLLLFFVFFFAEYFFGFHPGYNTVSKSMLLLLASLWTGSAFQTASSTLQTVDPPDVAAGWNTSVGSVTDRHNAAAYFGTNVTEDNDVWFNNDVTSFINRTFRMTSIDIIERNAFNTLIEAAVRTGTVTWTIQPGAAGIAGDWVEHVNGGYTGTMQIAGFVNRSTFIENDSKSLFGRAVANDWGINQLISVTNTTLEMNYWSYQKARFIMTWTLQD